VLARRSGQEDIAIGTPAGNRKRTELEHLIGYFVNTLVLRIDVAGDPTFAELLERVRATALDAYAHQDLPFGKLVEALNPARRRTQQPLFRVMFTYVPAPATEIPFGRRAVLRPADLATVAAAFDLDFTVLEWPDGLELYLTYDSDLFERPTAERMLEEYERLLLVVAESPARRLGELAPDPVEHVVG
jgi:non-ribosomal peptide synthetase component F